MSDSIMNKLVSPLQMKSNSFISNIYGLDLFMPFCAILLITLEMLISNSSIRNRIGPLEHVSYQINHITFRACGCYLTRHRANNVMLIWFWESLPPSQHPWWCDKWTLDNLYESSWFSFSNRWQMTLANFSDCFQKWNFLILSKAIYLQTRHEIERFDRKVQTQFNSFRFFRLRQQI